MKQSDGKRAIVTGAARDVGPAFAEAHVPEGGEVASADVDITRARSSATAQDAAAIAVEMDGTPTSGSG